MLQNCSVSELDEMLKNDVEQFTNIYHGANRQYFKEVVKGFMEAGRTCTCNDAKIIAYYIAQYVDYITGNLNSILLMHNGEQLSE